VVHGTGSGQEDREKRLATDDYVYLSFMQAVMKDRDLFKWPDKADKLKTLMEDFLFIYSVPLPSPATSSSRSIMYALSKDDTKKANVMLNKAYYHTIFNVLVLTSRVNFWFISTLAADMVLYWDLFQ
jgi:hypothetical protein